MISNCALFCGLEVGKFECNPFWVLSGWNTFDAAVQLFTADCAWSDHEINSFVQASWFVVDSDLRVSRRFMCEFACGLCVTLMAEESTGLFIPCSKSKPHTYLCMCVTECATAFTVQCQCM